jgi:hypothetical protein
VRPKQVVHGGDVVRRFVLFSNNGGRPYEQAALVLFRVPIETFERLPIGLNRISSVYFDLAHDLAPVGNSAGSCSGVIQRMIWLENSATFEIML